MDSVFHSQTQSLTFRLHPSQISGYFLNYDKYSKRGPPSCSLLTPLLPRPSLFIDKIDLLSGFISHTYKVPTNIEQSQGGLPCIHTHPTPVARDFLNGYHILLNTLREQVILALPNALLCIWNERTGNLTHIFQTHGKYIYSITCARLHPLSQQLFFVATAQTNVYSLDLKNLRDAAALKSPAKLKLPKNIIVHDIWLSEDLESQSRVVFFACSDGLIRPADIMAFSSSGVTGVSTHAHTDLLPLFHYPNLKAGQDLRKAELNAIKKNLPLKAVTTIDVHEPSRLLISGNVAGYIAIFRVELQPHQVRSGTYLFAINLSPKVPLLSIKVINPDSDISPNITTAMSSPLSVCFVTLREDGCFNICHFKEQPGDAKYQIEILSTMNKTILHPSPEQPNRHSSLLYNLSHSDFVQTVSGSNVLAVALPSPLASLEQSESALPKRLYTKDISFYRMFSTRDPEARFPAVALGPSLLLPQLVAQKSTLSQPVEPYSFFLQSDERLSAFNLVKAKTHLIVDLSKHIFKKYKLAHTRFRDLDYRPKPSTARGDYFFILRLRREERVALLFLFVNMGDVLLSLAVTGETDEDQRVKLQLLRDYADGTFVGPETQTPHLMAALHHDFQQISILQLDETQQLIATRIIKLESPISRLHWTPWNNGRVILYEMRTAAAPQVRTTANIDPNSDPTDFTMSRTAGFKMQFDQIFIKALVSPQGMYLALLTNQRVYILAHKLKSAFQLNTSYSLVKEPYLNYISAGMWASDCAFLFTTAKYLHVLSPASASSNQAQILSNGSSDTVIMTLLYQDSVPSLLLPDRIILVSPNVEKAKIIQMCPLDIAPYLLTGYLTINKDANVSDPLLSNLLAKSKKCPSLLAKLPFKKLGLDSHKFLINKDISSIEKSSAISLEELGLGNKEQVQYFKARLLNDYSNERKLEKRIQQRLTAALQSGNYADALRYAEVLDRKLLTALLLLNKPEEAKKLNIQLYIQKSFKAEKGNQAQNIDFSIFSKIPPIETKPWFQGEEQNHPRYCLPGDHNNEGVMGDFDPVEFKEEDFTIQVAQDEGGAMETLEPLARVSLGDCFGFPSGSGNERKAGDQFMNATTSLFEQEASKVEGEQETSKLQSKLLPDDATPESFDQEKSILFYWRCAEGKGSLISDLTEFNLEGEIKGAEEPQWIQLNNGEPIEFEDKWGKRCPGNNGIALSPASSIKLKRLTPDALENLGEAFTVQFWFLHILEPDTANPSNLLSLFDVKAGSHQVAISLNLQKQAIAIVHNKSVVGECSPELGLEPKRWHHIAIVWKFIQGKLRIIFNSQALSQVNISKEARKAIRGSEWYWGRALQGLITEIRCWSINLSSLIVKQNFRAPCSFVHEFLGKFKLKTKSLGTSGLAPPPSGLKQSKGLAPPPSKKQTGGLMPPPKSKAAGGLLPPPPSRTPKKAHEEDSKEEEKVMH